MAKVAISFDSEVLSSDNKTTLDPDLMFLFCDEDIHIRIKDIVFDCSYCYRKINKVINKNYCDQCRRNNVCLACIQANFAKCYSKNKREIVCQSCRFKRCLICQNKLFCIDCHRNSGLRPVCAICIVYVRENSKRQL